MEEIRSIFQSEQYDDIIWGSDLNWDPSRNTQFSRSIANFIQEMGLVALWDSFPVPYTHVHTDGRSRSILDHFIVSPRLLHLVEDCGIVERGDNRSRHCPICISLKLGALPVRQPRSKWIPRKPDWSKATEAQKSAFKEQLEEKLVELEGNVDTSLQCQELHCHESQHSDTRDSHVVDILTAVIETSYLTLPTYGGCRVGGKRPGLSIPGWKAEVGPYRDNSVYWGDIWKSNGRPTTGWVYESYIAARKQYHYAVLRTKQSRHQNQAEQLLAASMCGEVNLLKEMKLIKKGQNSANSELPDHVGGADGEQAVAELFKESYQTLFNSAPSLPDMEQLKVAIDDLIGVAAKEEILKVSGAAVKEAVAKLKLKKTDVSGSFVSDAIKNAPDLMFDQLSTVFRSWLYHGTVTHSLLACSFIPLLKSSLKDPSNPDSYRAIAGSSLILKTFELVVLNLWATYYLVTAFNLGIRPTPLRHTATGL